MGGFANIAFQFLGRNPASPKADLVSVALTR
jgi:hypothetical protein